MQKYVIFNVLKEYCIPKEEEEEKPISARGLYPEGRYRSRDDNSHDMEMHALCINLFHIFQH